MNMNAKTNLISQLKSKISQISDEADKLALNILSEILLSDDIKNAKSIALEGFDAILSNHGVEELSKDLFGGKRALRKKRTLRKKHVARKTRRHQ